jgi:hypothetical protein
MAVYVPELKLARVLGILDTFMRRRRHRVRDIVITVMSGFLIIPLLKKRKILHIRF